LRPLDDLDHFDGIDVNRGICGWAIPDRLPHVAPQN
jgi:hypothetical protein